MALAEGYRSGKPGRAKTAAEKRRMARIRRGLRLAAAAQARLPEGTRAGEEQRREQRASAAKRARLPEGTGRKEVPRSLSRRHAALFRAISRRLAEEPEAGTLTGREFADLDPREKRARTLRAHRAGVDQSALVRGDIPYGFGKFGKAMENLVEAAVYSPAGVWELGKATTKDLDDAFKGDLDFERTRKLGKTVGKAMYEDIRHPLRNPGYTGLTVLAAASGGAGALSRVSAAGKAAQAARSPAVTGRYRSTKAPGPLRSALTRKPSEGGSLLRRPAPGRIEIAPGVYMNLSRNALVRAMQRRRLKTQKARPESRTGGGMIGRNLPERVGHERRRKMRIEEDIARAPAEGLRETARKIDDIEDMAVRVVAEGVPVRERLATHRRDRAAAKGSRPSAVLKRKRLTRQIRLLGEVQRRRLVHEVDGKLDFRPGTKMADVFARAEASGTRREDVIKELGLAEETQLAARKAGPARVFAGAEHVTTKAQAERKAHVRIYPGKETVVTRPRTEAEAKERLADLDARYAAAVEELVPKFYRGTPDEVARQNLANIGRGKGRKRGMRKLPSFTARARQDAEAAIEKALERNPDNPALAEVHALLNERAFLREVLTDPERVFGTKTTRQLTAADWAKKEEALGRWRSELRDERHPPKRASIQREIDRLERELSEGLATETGRSSRAAEFGTVTQTTVGPGVRRSVPGQEARRASAGFVGGETERAGRLFVSYADRRKLSTGRARHGNIDAIGIPKGDPLHGVFTGGAIHEGRIPKALKTVAEDELEIHRYRGVISIRKTAVAESISADELLALPESQRPHMIPVRVKGKPYGTLSPGQRARVSEKPYSQDTREFIDLIQGKLDEGAKLNRKERRELGERSERVRRFYFPDMDEAQALAAAARGEVRFVDRRRLGGLNESSYIGGKRGAIAKGAGTFADELNSAMQIAILFLKPAYLTPNLIGQSALTLIQQGAVAPWNMAQGVRLFRALDADERAMVRAAIGQGFAQAARPERGRIFRPVRNRMAHEYSKVLDSPFRWPAFIHEARMLGYDSPAKIKRLLRDKDAADDLVEVSQRTRNAMIDYADLTPGEQAVIRRVIFFYPWLKGSAKFTGRFVREHPVQAGVTAGLAREGEAQAMRDLGPVPWYARGSFKVGEDEKGRPLVANPRAAQLFESPVQFAESLAAFAKMDPRAGGARFTDLLSPAAQLPLQLAYPHDPLGDYKLSTPEALKRQYVENLPQVRLARELRDPNADDEDVLYPTSRKGALLKFGVGTIYPRPVNKAELNERARAEGRVGESPAQRGSREIFAERQTFYEAAKEHMPEALEGGRLPAPLREAFNRKAEVAAMRARVEDETDAKTQEREFGKYEGEVRLLQKWRLVSQAEAVKALGWGRSASLDDLATQRDRMRSRYFQPTYLDLIGYARNALEEKGAELD